MTSKFEDKVIEKYNLFDKAQKTAVEAILDKWSEKDGEFIFPIIDGAPGTGKTTLGTIATAKYLLENRNSQVVYLAYTHFAVEKAKQDLYKLGLLPNNAIELHYNKEMTNWDEGIYGCDSELKYASFNDVRRLKEIPVLLSTLHSARRAFKLRTSPKIIVDEFSQVSVPLFFSTLNKIFAEKCNPDGYALLGDPIQLPVISTQLSLRPNIGIYVMQRKPHEPHRLITQHRMHEDICEAINSLRKIYGVPRIETGQTTKDRDLDKLLYKWNKSTISSDISEILDPANPFVIINTDHMKNESKTLGGSVMNTEESDYAAKLSLALQETFKDKNGDRLEPRILSPYTAQVGEIRQKLPFEMRNNCITIYRSQGREYPCVIISFARNNDMGSIGFMGEAENALREQVYVGCSRAEAKLILLLSFKTFLNHGHTQFESLIKTKDAYIIDKVKKI